METKFDVNKRIIELINARNVDEIDVARAIGKDKSTVYRIVNMEVVPSKTTVKLIAEAYAADYEYLQHGKMQQNATKKELDNPWREEAYANLKEEKEYFKQKYEKAHNKLERIMESLLRGEKPENLNFPKASELYAGVLINSALSEARHN